MAIAQVKTVDIDTQGAVKSLSDLRKQISETKNALYTLQEGSEEYNDKLQELDYAQQELSSFMAKTRQGCAALEGSYNALSYLLGLLKQEYKATNDEAQRSALAELISEIDGKLKDMDAAVGVFSRNVGNYTGAMNEVFGKLGINVGNLSPIFTTFANNAAAAGAKGKTAFQGLSAGAKGLGNSLKALAANPVGAVIMGIVLAVKAMKAGFDAVKASVERNEAAQNNLKKAMAPIKGIIDIIRNAFDSLVEVLTKVAGWIGTVVTGMMEFLGIAGEASSKQQEIADLEVSNAELHRKFLVENAQLELDASEARAKAAQKDKYSALERLKLLNEYATKQKTIAANNLKEAQDALKLLEKQAETGKNNAEMNDKIAEAQAKVLQVQTAYNNTIRETNSQVSELSKTIKNEEQNAHKKAAEEAKKHADEIAKLRENFAKLTDTLSTDLMTNNYDKQRKQVKKEYDENVRQFNEMLDKKAISQEEYNNAIHKANNKLYMQTAEINFAERQALEEFANGINNLQKSDELIRIEEETKKWELQQKAVIDAYATGLLKSTEDFDNALKIINKKAAEEIAKLKDDIYSKKAKDNLDAELNANKIFNSKIENEIDASYVKREMTTKDYIAQKYDMQLKANNDEIAAYENYQTELDDMYEKGKLSDAAYTALCAENSNNLANLRLENAKLVRSKEEELMDIQLNALATMTDTLSSFARDIASIGEGISSKWGDVFSSVSTVIDNVGIAMKSNEKGFTKWAQVAASACAAVSSVFGALADEQNESTVEGFELAKKLRYAEALFSMASGIISVWPAAMQLGPIAGPIMGSIMSAMIAGVGIAQMAQISKTKFGDTTSGNSAAAASSSGIKASIQAPVQYTSDIQGLSAEDNSKDTRVYVTESDITATQRKVSVAQNEAYY